MSEIEGKEKPADVASMLLQWQTCVESANIVSQRRDTINGIFVTLSLAVVTCSTAFWSWKSIPILLVGLVICAAWFLYLYSLKTLNKAKFEVINRIEEQLPLSPFADEWSMIAKTKRYLSGTSIEKLFPSAFAILFLTLLIIVIFSL